MPVNTSTITGVGLSARPQHFAPLMRRDGDLPWLEILADNYLHSGSLQHQKLEQLSELYPLTFHCVNMSIGSSDELNWNYLKEIKSLQKKFSPQWVSDHLCWVSQDGKYLNDLIPLPYTDEVIKHIACRINKLQDFFEQTLVIENVSHYLSYKSSTMTEAEFICAILEETQCDLLLDLNNLYVNSINHNLDASAFLKQLPASQIRQIHLAGHSSMGNHLLDTHSTKVAQPVWQLYGKALGILGDIPTCLEWDSDIPDYSVMLEQTQQANSIRRRIESQTPHQLTQGNHIFDSPMGNTLQNVQKEFRQTIETQNNHIESKIIPLAKLNGKECLDIYRKNYQANLYQVLEDTFPACQKNLGREVFISLAHSYIKNYTHRSYQLSDYGSFFSQHIQSMNTQEAIPFLSDLACLEWELKILLLSPLDESTSIKVFTSILKKQGNQTTLQRVSHIRIIKSLHPIDYLWQCSLHDSQVDSNSGSLDLQPSDGEKSFLLIKNIHSVSIIPISDGISTLLTEVQTPRRVSELEPHLDILSQCIQMDLIKVASERASCLNSV